MAGLDSLPLFHRIAGMPVIVLGQGEMAEPKRRLVERAGGEIIDDLQEGVDRGARLAFVAHDSHEACEADAIRLRCAGLLVNVVDRPELCDFTTPSILDRNPLLIAIGTGGASAGLAKHVRLRLDALLPARLGELARALYDARPQLRSRWADGAARRRALDAALGQGGALDPLDANSVDRVEAWVQSGHAMTGGSRSVLHIASDDPEDLTLRQARLLGMADVLLVGPGIAPAIVGRARADAQRIALPCDNVPEDAVVLELRRVP